MSSFSKSKKGQNSEKKNALGIAGSKEFQNSNSSACHFALVLQLDKEGKSTCPDQVFPSKDKLTSGFFEL